MACPSFLSDDDLRRFRTKPCQRSVCEFGVDRCQYSHCTAWVRRCPFYLAHNGCLRYVPLICPDAAIGYEDNGNVETNECRRGGYCPFAHSLEELYYHPLTYKTQQCESFARGLCKTYYCPYVHGTAERRCVERRVLYLPFATSDLRDVVSTAFPRVIFIPSIPKQRPQSGASNDTTSASNNSSRPPSPAALTACRHSNNNRLLVPHSSIIRGRSSSNRSSGNNNRSLGNNRFHHHQQQQHHHDNYFHYPQVTGEEFTNQYSNQHHKPQQQQHPLSSPQEANSPNSQRFTLRDFPVVPTPDPEEEDDSKRNAIAMLRPLSRSFDRFLSSGASSDDENNSGMNVFQQLFTSSPSLWGSEQPTSPSLENFCWMSNLGDTLINNRQQQADASSPNWPSQNFPSEVPAVTVTNASGAELVRREIVQVPKEAGKLAAKLRELVDQLALFDGDDAELRGFGTRIDEFCIELKLVMSADK